MKRKKHNKRQPKNITLKRQKALLHVLKQLALAMCRVQQSIKASQPIPNYIKGGVFNETIIMSDGQKKTFYPSDKVLKMPVEAKVLIDKQKTFDDFVENHLKFSTPIEKR